MGSTHGNHLHGEPGAAAVLVSNLATAKHVQPVWQSWCFCLITIPPSHPIFALQHSVAADERRILQNRARPLEIGHDTRPPRVSQHGAHLRMYVCLMGSD